MNKATDFATSSYRNSPRLGQQIRYLNYSIMVFAEKGKPKDQQSSIITRAIGGGPNSGLLDGQQYDISDHIGQEHEKVLDYDIRVVKGIEAPHPTPNFKRVNEYGYNPSNPVTLTDISRLQTIELVGIPRKTDQEIQTMFEQKTSSGNKIF